MIADQTGTSTRNLPDLDRATPAPPRSLLRLLVWSGLAAALIAGIAAGAIEFLVDDRRATLEAAAATRIEAVAQGRAAVLNTWLDGAGRIGRRLSGSELIRLFAAGMAHTDPGTPPAPWLIHQRRYIAHQIADLVHQHDLLGVALYGLEGRTLLTSLDAPVAGIRGLDALIAELQRSGRAFGPIRQVEGAGLVVDILLPVPGPQPATSGEVADVVAALAITAPADQLLARVLAGLPAGGGGAVRLVQLGPTGRATVVTANDGGLRLATGTPAATRRGDFALEVPVPGPSWTLELTFDDGALGPALQSYRRDLTRMAVLAGGGLLLALAGLWRLHDQLHRRDLRCQVAALREQEPAGAGAFDVLAQLVHEPVAIKTGCGRYRYVNPALARVFGLPAEAIVGRTDAEILGEAAAAALAASDGQVLDGRAVLDEAAELEIAGQKRSLRVFKLPLRNHLEEVMGVLVAAHDASAEVHREREGAELVAQVKGLICALAAPEASSWLARVQRLRRYAFAVARRLDLPADQRETLDQAAFWSQIGRLPSAAAVDVTMPAMLEGPAIPGQRDGGSDGRGAAAGAEDRQGGLPGRILEVLDAFITLTDGLAGAAISPGHALYRLAEQRRRFDVRVIAALAAVIEDEGPTTPADATLASAIETDERQRRRERAA